MGILGLFWIHLVFSLTIILLLSATTSISADVIDDQVTDAENWLRSSESREVTEADEPCNASPYLSYLHSHLKSLFMENWHKSTTVRSNISAADVTYILRFQPLIYSFYLKNVLQEALWDDEFQWGCQSDHSRDGDKGRRSSVRSSEGRVEWKAAGLLIEEVVRDTLF
jgi:hypothetical protein